tara:strand:+ start:645 stop:1835 length:1191 start_codon:yes stop_codon:yes gene_type:complete
MRSKTQIGKIKKNPDNPRIIKDVKFKKLVQSIKDFPAMLEKRPIVVDENMVVLGGNMRLKACKEAGLKEVWIDQAKDWTEEQKREFIIKDNSGYGEWDWDILANEWDVKQLNDWALDLPPMFDEAEVEAEEDYYEEPDNLKVDVQAGDLITFEKDGQELHRLLCGDSTKKEDVEKLMNGEKADIIHTDPPYNVAYGESKKPRHKIRKIKNDKMNADSWKLFCSAFINNLIKFSKGGDVYIWGAPGPEGMKMRLWLVEHGFHWSATIIWKKQQLVLSPANYQRIYEPCFYGWNKKSSFVADRKQVELWEIDRPLKSKLHPTMKPIELCQIPIINSSKKNDIVLDFFLGSGSTMVAAHQLKRKCYGMELDPKYCQVIIDRMKKLDSSLEVKINGREYI